MKTVVWIVILFAAAVGLAFGFRHLYRQRVRRG